MNEFIAPMNPMDLIFIFLGIIVHVVLKLNKFINANNRQVFAWKIWFSKNWLQTTTSILCTLVFYVTASHDNTLLAWLGIQEWTIGNCLVIGFSCDALVKIFQSKSKTEVSEREA